MFKKLRNKFLLLNLVCITVMMLSSFSIIYIITYRNVYSQIRIELLRLSEIGMHPKMLSPPEPRVHKPIKENIKNNEEPKKNIIYFSFIVDNNNEISDIKSFFDFDDDFYTSIFEKIDLLNKNIGYFKFNKNYWTYIIHSNENEKNITVMDITAQKMTLINLIYAFIATALFMIVVIYLISTYFANKAILPIKESFEKQKQFIADASHELKTPLAVINTNLDIILSNEDETIKSQKKWFDYIKSENKRMNKLIQDLLYLAKIDYVNIIYNEFSLSEVIENIILTMEATIFEKNIILNTNVKDNVNIYGNKEQIHQVIMILLDNAIKYTNYNGNIDLRLDTNGNFAKINIKNTGLGIDSKNLNKIFDRFYRTDSSRARESGGYGLGLAIAKSIVEQHKGKIYAEGKLNEYATFTVELPIMSKQKM